MVYEALLAALLPETCPACRRPSAAGFCSTCAGRFATVPNPCSRCGLAQPVTRCPRAHGFNAVAHVVAPFVYGPPLDAHVAALKYRGARSLGRALGLLLAERARTSAPAVHALVPLPLHPRRLRERGYNQAMEIARAAGRRLRLPLVARGVRRRTAGAAQATLDARARYANTADAFAVERHFRGLNVAIIDDVITTGATVEAFARVLAAAGAARVEAWAVARAL